MSRPKKYCLPIANSTAALAIAERDDIPFEVKRVFWITSIPKGDVRGEHAHKKSEQLLICICGSLHITLENRAGEIYEFELSKSHEAVYIPPQYWGKITYTKESIILALASDIFDESDYIRDYAAFKSQL